MRVMIVGATGMIGQRLVETLSERGHRIILGVRNVESARELWPDMDIVRVDYADPSTTQAPGHLDGVDAVINAVGIFREQGKQTFDALHVKGPTALFETAAAAGVRRIVQISALGAHPYTDTSYLASKGRADAALHKLGVNHTIVQPSLVFAPNGRSTRWFALLAALPVTPLPGGGHQRIQPLHLDDLCDAIARLLEIDDAPARIEAVGPRPLTLRQYLAYFKQALRLKGTFVSVPIAWIRGAVRLSALAPGSLGTPEALKMLEAGSVGDCRPLASVLARKLRPVDGFISDRERAAMRRRAQLDWLLPSLRFAVAVMWIVTGLVSVFVFPVQSSLVLLARTGLHGLSATAALYGAAAIDIALGIGALFAATRRWSYRIQFLLIVFYTVIITAYLPEYWAHPYGPILKNIPLLAAIAVLHQLDDGYGSADR